MREVRVRATSDRRTLGMPMPMSIFASPGRRLVVGAGMWLIVLDIVGLLSLAIADALGVFPDGRFPGDFLLVSIVVVVLCASVIVAVMPGGRLRLLALRRRRTRLIDTCVRGLPSPPSDDLAGELDVRCRQWDRATSQFALADRWVLAVWRFRIPLALGWVACLTFWVVNLGPYLLEFSVTACAAVSVIAAGLLWALVRPARLRARLQATLHSLQCPDCEYDLAQVSPAVPRDLIGNAFVGPRRCPECGSLWPLIPPPAAAMESAR